MKSIFFIQSFIITMAYGAFIDPHVAKLSSPSNTRYKGKMYIDYLCGLGESTKELLVRSPRWDPISVVGVDPNPLHIRLARQKFPKLEFLNTNINTMKDQTADVIQVKCGFLHMKDRYGVIDHMYRILKPGGMLYVIDYSLDHPHLEELADGNIPIFDKTLGFHPDLHHKYLKNVFDDYQESWIDEKMVHSIYFKH